MSDEQVSFELFVCSDVSDIHDTIKVTVYDENPDKKSVFLGAVAIPLLKVLQLLKVLEFLSKSTRLGNDYFTNSRR
jgi:hypothetical protein